ncbi:MULTISPECIES: phage tail protein [Pseudomonas]|uniref:phage tail protein n=1 Tax=Pseudomonas TaxID=286 RepID=UPI00235DD58A|nr:MULTISPECIES: phage tail protein [Pseudomonas]
MADYYTLLTNAGIAYETACKAAGVPIKLSQISVGDGGGAVYNPAATDTALKREVWRGPLNALFQDEKNPSWLLAEVTIPPEVGGWYVREAGLWTDTGILYAIVKYPESFKPVLATSGSGKEFYIRSIFETSNASLVTLLIDDTVVKATRAWVTTYLADELAKLDGKQSVRAVATENIVLSGAQVIDGIALVAGQRVLLTAQVLAKDNGIYVVANDAWVRASDANTSAKVSPGLNLIVEEGAANGDSLWHLVTNGPITLGTTALKFEMLAGRTGIQAGYYNRVKVDKYGRVTEGETPETLAGHGIKDSYTKTEIDALVARMSALPVGTMVAFPLAKIPPGFLEVSADTIFKDVVYPDLAVFLDKKFNRAGDPADSTRLPESRAEFLRGWDHGRGVDAGREIGSYQRATAVGMDAVLANGAAKQNTTAAYQFPSLESTDFPGGIAAVSGDLIKKSDYPRVGSTVDAPDTGGVMFLDTDNIFSNGALIGARPRNLAVMWCIKAWNAPVNQGSIDIAALEGLARQATETNIGLARIATQTQVEGGSDDATFVTPKKLRRGFALSLASNGYIAFPSWLGGLIVQWGYVQTASTVTANTFIYTPVTWPIAFPNALLAATTSIVTGIASNSFTNTSIEGRTLTGGTWVYACGVNNGKPILSYIAIGY